MTRVQIITVWLIAALAVAGCSFMTLALWDKLIFHRIVRKLRKVKPCSCGMQELNVGATKDGKQIYIVCCGCGRGVVGDTDETIERWNRGESDHADYIGDVTAGHKFP